MGTKSKTITIISVIVLAASLIGSLFLTDSISEKLATTVTIVTAIIGAIALFIQFEKDKAMNRANFLIEHSKSFYNDYNLKEFYQELDLCVRDSKHKIDCDKYKIEIVTYLEWIESLTMLLNKKIIDFADIDDVFGYRYFLILNNKQIQDYELVPYYMFYNSTIKTYEKWYKYEKKQDKEIPLEKNSFHLRKEYKDIMQGLNKNKKQKDN